MRMSEAKKEKGRKLVQSLIRAMKASGRCQQDVCNDLNIKSSTMSGYVRHGNVPIRKGIPEDMKALTKLYREEVRNRKAAGNGQDQGRPVSTPKPRRNVLRDGNRGKEAGPRWEQQEMDTGVKVSRVISAKLNDRLTVTWDGHDVDVFVDEEQRLKLVLTPRK